MNIFFLHTDPKLAATMLCDKHIGKLQLETAQMLSTTAVLKYGLTTDYKPTHRNHPSTIWARDCTANLLWLQEYVEAMDEEWLLRKQLTSREPVSHKSYFVSRDLCAQMLALDSSTSKLSDVPLCMPEELWTGNSKHQQIDKAVDFYRSYYIRDKAAFATWPKSRVPSWWLQQPNN